MSVLCLSFPGHVSTTLPRYVAPARVGQDFAFRMWFSLVVYGLVVYVSLSLLNALYS